MELTKRPKIISIVCVIGYIWVILSLPSVFSPAIKRMGDWYPALFGLFTALYFFSYVGIWNLKKWGAHLLISAFFFETTTTYLLEKISALGIIIGAFSILVLLFYYKNLDENL